MGTGDDRAADRGGAYEHLGLEHEPAVAGARRGEQAPRVDAESRLGVAQGRPISQSMKKPATCMASRRSGGICAGPAGEAPADHERLGLLAAGAEEPRDVVGIVLPVAVERDRRSTPRASASAKPAPERRALARSPPERSTSPPAAAATSRSRRRSRRPRRARARRSARPPPPRPSVAASLKTGMTIRMDRSTPPPLLRAPSRIAVRHPPRAMPWTRAGPPPAPTASAAAPARSAPRPPCWPNIGASDGALGHPEAGGVAQVLAEEPASQSSTRGIAVARGVSRPRRRPRAGPRRRAPAAPASADPARGRRGVGRHRDVRPTRRPSTSAWTVAPRAARPRAPPARSSVAPSPITGPL